MDHTAPQPIDPRPLDGATQALPGVGAQPDAPAEDAPDSALDRTPGSAPPRPTGPVVLDADCSLDPRHVVVKRLVRAVTAVALSGGTLVAGVATALLSSVETSRLVGAGVLWSVVTAVLAALAIVWPRLAHEHASYRVDARGIEIRSGVWWRSTVSVPRSRVQHIDVSQGPLERRHGIAVLSLFTAGTEHALVRLPGLDHRMALALRDHLLPSGDDDAV